MYFALQFVMFYAIIFKNLSFSEDNKSEKYIKNSKAALNLASFRQSRKPLHMYLTDDLNVDKQDLHHIYIFWHLF